MGDSEQGSLPGCCALHIKWPKYWSFSFSISPSSEYSGLISFRTLPSEGMCLLFISHTVLSQKGAMGNHGPWDMLTGYRSVL